MAAADRIGTPLLELDEVSSTNDIARDRALAGAAEGLVVVAKQQTRGRGRRGHRWESSEGKGLYLSVLLRPGWSATEATWLGALAALAAWDAARGLGVDRASIKWPNDVMVVGRKLAGVLVEPRIAAGRVEFAVLGIGLNVAQEPADWPEELRGAAVSLRELGVVAAVGDVRAAVCRSLAALYARCDRGAAAGLADDWRRATGGRELPVLA